MKKQQKIIIYLIAILMLLQPLMVTVAYATENNEETVTYVSNEAQSITISDTALYEALKLKLGNKASYTDSSNTIEIYGEELNSITELKIEDSEISDLSGIEFFTELTYLDLSGNKLTADSGLDKINSLTKLTYLDLSRNQIEDVSAISSLLNKDGLDLDLDQDIKVYDFVSIIKQPSEYPDAENILINDIKESIDLTKKCPILLAYDNMNISITEIKADGEKVDKAYFSEYAEIKDGILRILNRDNSQYEIKLKLEGALPTHGTTCEIKTFRIDTDNQEGIVFKDENLYKAIKEKYEYALGIKKADFIHSSYAEWSDYEFISGQGNEWVFDNENLIIIANKKELRMLETLSVQSLAISDLAGIENFVGLKSISLINNRIIDVSKIIELDENKELTTEEVKQQYRAYVEKLATLASEYSSLKTQIEVIEKEIEDLNKAIANGDEITSTETVGEKEDRKYKLEVKQAVILSNIKTIIEKIEEISNIDGTQGISSLLTSPSIRKEIEEITKEAEKANDVFEQKEVIENNKLVDLASRINALLDNLTEAEILKLADAGIILSDKIDVAKAKCGIEEIKVYIDQIQDTGLEALIRKVNTLTNSEISSSNSDNTKKDSATIKNELKLALNKYYSEKNGISSEDIIEFCVDNDIASEDELLLKAKDTIIPIIKENILEAASENSEYIIKDLKENIVDNVFNLDAMKEKNDAIIKDLLIPSYEELNELLETLRIVLSTKEYLNNPDDLLRIVKRLETVSDEDIKEVVKLPDLATVRLNRNIINNADKLSEIETLKVLELDYNLISKFDFAKFQKIEQLYLENNSIKNPEITGMENIRILKLSGNWIDDITKINLSGMPKLSKLYLDNNRINNIEHLINSKNEYIETLGYKNVGEYWQDGNIGITIGGQSLGMITENRSDLTDIEVALPAIYAQMKELETPKFEVTFECTEPLYNVSQDGKMLKVDAEYIYETRHYGYVYMNVGEIGKFTLTVGVFYEDDTTAPTITGITGITEEFTTGDVTLAIEGATDEVAGLHEKPYSFDNGTTWQVYNTKTFIENTENIVIKVRDAQGNIYTHEPINITNIDKTAPAMDINREVIGTESGKSSVTIAITEDGSGLNEENKYEYYLSTSKDEQVGGTLTTFVPGTAFEIGDGLAGTYYMFINTVSDKAGNVSEELQPIEFTFVIPDTTAPTITGVTGNPENWTNEDVTLTIEGATDETALDNEAYSFDGGASWQVSNTKIYTENTKDINILVRDAAGNVYTHEVLEISKIDKTAPAVNVSTETTDDGKAKVTISVTDEESGLNSANEYKYNVSTSKEELTNEEWTEYKLGETFEIGENLENGKYYITIKNVKDNANNESAITPIEVTLETKAQGGNKEENGTLEYLTLSGITKLIRAYITDDYSNLPESFLEIAGDDNKFDLNEITKVIRLYLAV